MSHTTLKMEDSPISTPVRRAFSSSVFCRNEGKILLINHKKLQLWLPVGGELEVNETPLEAAVRELFEETGLSGNYPDLDNPTGAPPGFLGYEEHFVAIKGFHMNFCFLCDVQTRNIASDNSFVEHAWVTPDDAIKMKTTNNVLQMMWKIEAL